MPTREQLTHERVEALLDMMESDGATPAGEPPRPEDLEALRKTRKLGSAREIAENFKNNIGSDSTPS